MSAHSRHVYVSKHSRRLDDRIRDLCAKVVASKDAQELELLLPELRARIHEAIQRVRTKAVAILTQEGEFPVERRDIP